MKKTSEIHFENPSKEFCQKIKFAKQEFHLTSDLEVMSRIFVSHLCPEFCDQCTIISTKSDGRFELEYQIAQVGFLSNIEGEDLDELSKKCLINDLAEYRIFSDNLVLAIPLSIKGEAWGVVRLSTNLNRIKNKQDYILCINELTEYLFLHLEKQLTYPRKK